MTPPHIPPEMESPQFDEDDVEYAAIAKMVLITASAIFIAAFTIGAIILLAWRGWKCGV